MEDTNSARKLLILLIITEMVVVGNAIPTTLEGPFRPVTIHFDPSLRQGSDDLPMDHPKLKRNVTSIFPEQVSLAISSPTSMWVSWVTGMFIIISLFPSLNYKRCKIIAKFFIFELGDAQIGTNVTQLDPSSVASEVWYGKERGEYSNKTTGGSTVYSQLYPFEGLLNYTSGIIHHVRLDGINIYKRI